MAINISFECLYSLAVGGGGWDRRAAGREFQSLILQCGNERFKGEVEAKNKISPVVVFGVLSRMVLVRES